MAVAGCINAYDCAGCYLTTLQQLQSDNIGVAINYTAPGEYGRRQLDYIKYTDKCGCTCCLTGENELRIVATQGVIKNFTLTNDDTNKVVNVKWTEVFGSNRAKTIVRYKTTGYPTSPTDGTLAVESTVKNQYATNGFNVSGLEDGTTYYFTAFAVDSLGTIINVQSITITTDFIKRYIPNTNTKVYIPMDVDLLDHGPHSLIITNHNSVSISSYAGCKFNVGKFSGGIRYLTFPNIDDMSGAWTISVRVYLASGISQIMFSQGTNAKNRLIHVGYSSSGRGLVFGMYNNDADTKSTQWIDGKRHNYTFTRNGSTGYNIIVDGVSAKSGTLSSGFYSGNNTGVVGQQGTTTSSMVEFQGYMSEFFIETGQWTVAQTLEYVNKTKKNYGLT